MTDFVIFNEWAHKRIKTKGGIAACWNAVTVWQERGRHDIAFAIQIVVEDYRG